jgi:tetratricopeptide (TPR) repeat protein
VPIYPHHLGGVCNNLARIYHQQGDLEKAQAYFLTAIHYQRNALGLNRSHAGYQDALCNHYQNLMQLLLGQEDHTAAARCAEKLAHDLPNYWLAAIRAANAAEQCRRLVRDDEGLPVKDREALKKEYLGLARRWLARTAQLAEHPAAKDLLAWHLAHDAVWGLRDARQAVELADAAVKMQPRRAKYWLTLGSAYCRLQEWPRAILSLRTAWRLDREESGEVCFFLAIAHWHDHSPEQAQFWYRRGLSWMRRHQRGVGAVRDFQVEAAALLEGIQESSAPG